MRLIFFYFILMLCVSIANAQYLHVVHEKAPRLNFEDAKLDKDYSKNIIERNAHNPSAVLIGKMWGPGSTQASYTNQIFTDPFSGLICVIHRGSRNFPNSGTIVYQTSSDYGMNWTTDIGLMNLPGSMGRHPNVVLSNPTKDMTPGNQSVVASFTVLTSSWYFLEFSSDSIVGCNCYKHFLDSTYYPNDEMFINSKGDIFTVAPKIDYQIVGADTINMDLFISTNRGVTWTKRSIAKTSDFEQDTWNGTKAFINKNGIGYIMVQGKKAGQDFYSFGYKKTTNDGLTWDANWTWVNPYTIPALSGKVHALNYEVDAITDYYGKLHFVGTFVDTVNKGMAGNTGIYHLWGEGTSWNAGLVSKVLKTSFSLPGGLLTLNECEFTSSSGYGWPFIALKWIDLPTATDSLPDIFLTEFHYISGVPFYVRNLTNTPNINEKYSQMSAWSSNWGIGCRADIMYTIFGNGDTMDLAEAELWYLTGVYFGIIVEHAEDDFYPPIKFQIFQNFPNPFNNQTRLEFFVPYEFNGNVVIKVYDILGKEVATLVNEHKKEGLHSVTFNGENLPSGAYIFELKANNIVKRVKGILLK